MGWFQFPDEGRVLPPPSLVNRGSVYLGFLGYMSAIFHNAINQYPVLRTGVHRQILYTTIGVFIGYHLTKYENYRYAKKDQEMFDYIRRHPEILPHKDVDEKKNGIKLRVALYLGRDSPMQAYGIAYKCGRPQFCALLKRRILRNRGQMESKVTLMFHYSEYIPQGFHPNHVTEIEMETPNEMTLASGIKVTSDEARLMAEVSDKFTPVR